MPANRSVGVIGLGAMGQPMTEHLLDAPGSRAGSRVGITGRGGSDRFQGLIDQGARWYETPAALAADADVVLLMLPDLPQVEEVLDGPDGVLAGNPDDLVVVVGSTCSAAGLRDLGTRVHDQTDGRVRFVDAPVSGGVEGGRAGTLSIMVGGDPADVARVRPILETFGRPVHLGPLGAGEVAKACNQLIVGATVLALGEAAVLAERSGIDVATMFALFEGGYADSQVLRTRGRSVVSQDYSPAGPARFLLKDLDAGAAVAEATHTDAVLLPAVQAAFRDIVDLGLGDLDMAVTRRYVAERG